MNIKNYIRLFAVVIAALFAFTLANAKDPGKNNLIFKSSRSFKGISNEIKPAEAPFFGPLILSINPLCSSCCGSSAGGTGGTLCSTGVNVSGGTPPYSYAWSNGATTQCIVGLTPGTYFVIVTDALGATSTLQIPIQPGPCCKLVCPNDTTICFQVPDSLVKLGKPKVVSTVPTAPDPCFADSIWNNSTGVYPVGTTVIIWYAKYPDGHIDTCKQNVIRNPAVPFNLSFTTSPAAVAGVINICNGQSITFTNTSTGSTGQLWNFGNGYYSSNVTHTQVYTFPPGTYTVTLTVYDACGFKHDTTLTVIVDPNSGPDIECISVVCPGDTVTYHTNANCTTYTWVVNGGTIISTPLNNDSITVVWGPGPTGTISLTVTGCTPPSTCAIATVKTVNIVPATLPVKGDTVVCSGSTSTYCIACIPGNVHTWIVTPVAAYDSIKYNDCCVTIYWSKTFFGTVSINVNYTNVLTGSGCNLPDGCPTDHGCQGTGNLTVIVKPIFGISGPTKVCPNTVSAPFNGMNLTNNTIAPGVSWKLVTPTPSTLTFANTGLLNAYTWPIVGVYTLTAYAPPGVYCNDSAIVNVTVVEIKTPNPIQGPDTVCPGSTNFYTVQPNMSGVQYIWNVTGAGTPFGTTITSVPTLAVTWGAGGGTISVQQQLLASPFCTSPAVSFTVVTWPPFTLPVVTANPGGASCLKTSVTYCYTGPPLSNATYLWSVVPSTAGNITTANGGNCITIQWVDGSITPIFVKLKITRCYSDSVMFPVTLLALPPVPSISYSPLVICKGTPVSFTTTSPGPIWSWSFGDLGTSTLQNPTHTYTTAGNFTVSLTVTNSNGCSDTAFTNVHVEDVPVLPVITGNATACLNSFASYSFSQPFFPGASYNWSLSGGGNIISGQGSNSINVQWVTSGAHQVFLSVTSLCPPGAVVPFNVFVNPLPTVAITLPSPSCVGSALTFSSTGSPVVSYSWSFAGGSPSASTAASPVVTYNIVGTYAVGLTVTDANGCTATALTSIAIHELPIAFITTPDADGCTFPYPVNIYAVNSGGYSFSWIPTGTTGPVLSTTVTATTTYSVLVTNQFGCTQMSNAITFTNGNCPAGPPQPGQCVTQDSINFTWNPPLCLQDSFFVSGSALPPYNWFFDYAGATATGSAVSNTYVYPGYYKVTVCGLGRGFIYPAMTVPCPNIPICKMRPVKIPFDAKFKVAYACAGNVMQTIITNTSLWAGANTYTWNWYLDGSGTPFSSVTNPPNQAISPGPHNITLIISDPGAGNTLATCTLTVGINVPTPIVANFTSPAQVCKGFAAAFLDTSTPLAFTRLWTSAGAPSTTTNPANLIYTVAGATTVTLNISDIYGCTSSASANVNVQQGTGTITVVNNGACDSVQLVASGNPNYIWTYFSPVPSVLSNTVYVKTGGFYSVVAIDPSNGCPYSATTPLITVKKPPIATITGKTTYCQGEKLDLKTSSAGSVVWRYDFDSYVSIQGTLPNMTNVASVPGTFIYRVTITGANGCTASATIQIVVDPVPASATIVGGPTTICDGDSVNLSVAPPGSTYLWSKTPPPAFTSTAPSIWVTKGGTYSVIVQTVNGCYYPAIPPKTITVNPLPPVKISGDTVLCEGETLVLTTINVGGATYLWSGPGGGGASNPLQINNMLVSGSGVYTVTVTYTATGCSSTATINVIVHPNPIVPIIAANVPGVLCQGPLYTDSVTPGTIDGSLNPLDYVWNTGQQGYSIFAANVGSYFVTATNQWGCSSVSNTITIHPNPDLSCVPSGCYDFCSECDSVEIPAPAGFFAYQWQILTAGVFVNYSTSQNLKVYVPGGKFRLIVFNQWGCADSSDTLKIKFHDCCTPNDTVSCIDTTICEYFFGAGLQGFAPYAPTQPNALVQLSNVGGQFPGDQFIKVTDQPGASAVKGGTQFNGKWCCGHFCFDFKIFNDGVTGSPNYFPSFKIYNGTLGFLFTSNVNANENNGWHRINACVSKDSIPTNTSQGVWTPIAPATAADWSLVAGNVTDLVFVTDFSGDNGEVCGIDNICFYPETFTVACAKIETCGGTTVVVTVIDTADCPVFKYKWSNGATTQFLQSVPPGTYCVTVSNCCGCVDSCCVTVLGNQDTLHVTDTIYHITCDSIYGGIDVTPHGGHPPYIYDWSNGATTQDINQLVAGVYTLTMHDSLGCSVTIHDTVIINTNCHCNDVPPPPPPTITINSITADSCNMKGCIHATFTGCCLRFSYTYFDPCNPVLSYSVAQTTDSSIFCNLKAGTYIMYVADPCGNIVQQTVTIPLINGPLTVSVHYSNCADSICLNVEGGCPPYTYLWLGGATTQCITGFPTCVDSYVTVTDSRGCSLLKFVTFPGITFPTVVHPTCCLANGRICPEVCFAQQPYLYTWSNGATTKCINNLVAGTYCVTVTNANGATISCCYTLTGTPIIPPTISFNFGQCGSTVTAIVDGHGCPFTVHWENNVTGFTRDNLHACDSITLTVTMCNGTSYTHGCRVPNITAAVTPVNCFTAKVCVTATCFGCGPLTYAWPANPVCPASTTNCFTCVPGYYTVCITNCQGDVVCCPVVIPAIPNLTVSLVSKVNPTSVSPTSGSININASGGTPPYTYLWSNGATTQNVSGLSAGTYTVIVTDSTGCTGKLVVNLKLICKLSYTTIVVQPASCFLNNGIITIVPSGGSSYTYLWSTTPVQTTATATGLPYGSSVTVIITDVISGCILTATIPVPTSLGLGVVLTGTNISCNGGSNGTITSTVSGSPPPYIYQWSNGATTANLTGLSAGTYTLIVTKGNCDAIATITITQPPAIVLTITKVNPTCGAANGLATVAATGGTPPYAYIWSTAPVQTTTTATGLGAGTYTVTVTDSKGCTKTKSVTLTSSNSVVITAIVTGAKCFGSSTGSIDITPSGGNAPYTYLWSNGSTTQDQINKLAAGTYTVTVTDKNGCTGTFSATITQPLLLTVTASATPVSCFGGKDGTLSASASGGTPPYTYSWNTVPAKTGAFVTGIKKGTYTVIATDSKGCFASATVIITEPPSIVITTTKTNVNAAGSCNGTATASATGGVTPYSYSWSTAAVQTNQTATGLCVGTYTVTVTDVNGCTKTKSVTITQPAKMAANTAPDGTPYSFLYPNPSTGLTTVTFNEFVTTNVTIAIFNTGGQKVFEKVLKPAESSNSFEMDLSQFAKGIYTVKYNANDKGWVDKLVIQ